ncbi:cupin domain-containing protein [Candidatus Wolfebacteria bacterium]|nr:cupin domain-containing protein [Candidatus Wolfebacteria bacterium]
MEFILEKAGDIKKIKKHGIDLEIYSDINDHCGVVLVSTEEGHNQEFYDKVSTFTYIVLEGNGTYVLADKEVHVSKGDLISIPPNTRFYYKGKMRLVLITTPAFQAGNEVETQSRVW